MKVLQLADGRNVARWRDPISGKQVQQSLDVLGLRTVEARQAWAATKAATIAATRATVTAGITASVRIGLGRSLTDYLQRFGNARTMQNKKVPLEAFIDWCARSGAVDAQDIVALHLVRYRDHLLRPTTSTLALSTRNRHLVAVAVFVNWLRTNGYAPQVSSDHVRQGLRREKEPREAIEILRPAEVRSLLEVALRHDATSWAKAKAAPFLLLAVLTGMRSTELRLLEWSEVDLEHAEVRLPAARTKTATARTVDLSVCPVAVDLLRALPRTSTRVFPLITQGRLELVVLRLRKMGAPTFSMHTLRRTCGTITTCAPGIFGAASVYMSARRLGHAVEVAERSYLGVLQVEPGAKTIEAALGIADLAAEISRSLG